MTTTMTPNAIAADIELLLSIFDDIDLGWQAYSETRAEHQNETALFGDSWPGAQIELREMHARLTASEDQMIALQKAYPVHGPFLPEFFPPDEPF